MLLGYLAGTALGLVAACRLLLGDSGARACAAALGAGLRRRDGRRVLLTLALLTLAVLLEARFDPHVTARVGRDYTAAIAMLEGDLVGRVQALTPHALRQLLALHYVFAFPVLLLSPLVVHHARGEGHLVRRWLRTAVACWLLALPGYLFVPVREPAWSGLSSAAPALESLRPGLTSFLRLGSGVDNSLPSLHVGLQLALVGHARRAGWSPMVRLAAVATSLTAWATLALGIHWLIDALAALPLAWAALRLGHGPASLARGNRPATRAHIRPRPCPSDSSS